jgi:hypothetical protein
MSVSKALIICLFGIALGSELLLGRFILVFLPLIITGATNVRIKKISKKFPIGDEPILK